MFLMTSGTAILHRIGFVKRVSAAAEFGMTDLTLLVDFLNPTSRAARAKTIAYHLRKLPRSQLPVGDERFVMTRIAIFR